MEDFFLTQISEKVLFFSTFYDNSLVWLFIKILHYVAQYSNITERKLATQQLRQSEIEFRQIFENAVIGMALVDKNGNWTRVNNSFCKMLGYTREELLQLSFQQLTHPEELTETITELRKLANDEQEVFYKEERFIHKNGKDIFLIVGVSKVTNEQGKLTHYVAQYSDITERKEAEEKIRKLSILEAKSKEMEQFTYIASHDLREPLTNIKGYLSLITEEFAAEMPKDAQHILQAVMESANRMDDLIHGLLDYSKLSQVKELASVDVQQLLKVVVADMSVSINKNNAQINIKPLPIIAAYPLELKLLFQNLISNAIKFRRSTVIPQINISCQKIEKGWQFEVQDNGIGIEASEKERVFHIFQRLHRQDYEGTGIGLANCKKIVELHNGEIWVTSELDNGSTFHFTILTTDVN